MFGARSQHRTLPPKNKVIQMKPTYCEVTVWCCLPTVSKCRANFVFGSCTSRHFGTFFRVHLDENVYHAHVKYRRSGAAGVLEAYDSTYTAHRNKPGEMRSLTRKRHFCVGGVIPKMVLKNTCTQKNSICHKSYRPFRINRTG